MPADTPFHETTGPKSTAAAPYWYVETESLIDAPLSAVWQVIVDVNDWNQWGNRLPFRVRGPLESGARLWMGTGRSGLLPIPRAHWQAVDTERSLRWGGSIPGLRIDHWITLHPAEGGTCVLHGEGIEGPLARIIPKMLRAPYAALLGFILNRKLERHFSKDRTTYYR